MKILEQNYKKKIWKNENFEKNMEISKTKLKISKKCKCWNKWKFWKLKKKFLKKWKFWIKKMKILENIKIKKKI